MKALWSFLVVAVLASSSLAADWPSFRGPHSSGVSEEKGLPAQWSDTENLVWKTNLPGPGGSSPIVWADKVFVTCYSGYGLDRKQPGNQEDLSRHLVCVDRKNGNVLWDKAVKAKLPEQRFGGQYLPLHGYASNTPVTDGERIFVFHGKSGVFAYDFNGNQIWQASVGTGIDGWGSATSPVLYKDLVIVNASVESGSIVALKKKDGSEEWKADGVRRTWNSPVLVDVKDGKQELVIRATKSILGIDPATGRKLWHCDGVSDGYVCPTVVAKEGIVYSLGGRFQGMNVAVKAGGEGDVTSTNKLWSKNVGLGSISSPVLFGDLLYWVAEDGTVNCLNAKNGAKVYSERLKNTGRVYASVTLADDKIYVVSREKGTYVLAAGPKFKQLALNTFDSDKSIFNGSLAVSGGQLFLRSDKCLYCIGKK
jgi:outer membrane protein assembly factor BamB